MPLAIDLWNDYVDTLGNLILTNPNLVNQYIPNYDALKQREEMLNATIGFKENHYGIGCGECHDRHGV